MYVEQSDTEKRRHEDYLAHILTLYYCKVHFHMILPPGLNVLQAAPSLQIFRLKFFVNYSFP